MALIQSDIDKLKKGAINFLYIFIDPNAKGLSEDVMNKRTEQINQLKEIYQKNPEYSFQDLVNIVYNGIISRYGETPAQKLQKIFNVSVRKAAVGSPSPTESNYELATEEDRLAAEAVESISTTVTENGTTKKANFWEDAKNVIEWLVQLFVKIFGGQNNAGIYSPTSGDWKYGNRPLETSQAGFGIVGYLVLAGIGVSLFMNASKSDKNRKKNKS
ncbi:hypothetical protein TRIP_D300129 [uncultured Paludibacter sp.]|nr:hypothetical protein TRIP_D300129 [uncultured Paludibacter sp.]